MSSIHCCPSKCQLNKQSKPIFVLSAAVLLISSIALAAIMTGLVASGLPSYLTLSVACGLDLIALAGYIISVCIKSRREKEKLTTEITEVINRTADPEDESLFEKLLEKKNIDEPPSSPIGSTFEHRREEEEDVEGEDTVDFYSAESGENSQLKETPEDEKTNHTYFYSLPSKEEFPFSQQGLSPNASDRLYRDKLANEVIPPIFQGFGNFLIKAVEIDKKKTNRDGNKPELALAESFQMIIDHFKTHFQTLVKSPTPYRPKKSSQILRRMIAAWNTRQYDQLKPLFSEFDLAKQIESKEKIDSKNLLQPKLLTSEEDLKNLLHLVIYHCSLIMRDVAIFTTESTKDYQQCKNANISYLMQESKELFLAPKEELQEWEEVLKTQAEVNYRLVNWKKWTLSNSQEYMFIRDASDASHDTQTLYNEILSRIPKNPKNANNDYSHLLLENEKMTGYYLIHCTLGKHGTFTLKWHELGKVFVVAKKAAAHLAKFFKGTISEQIRKGLETEQVLQPGDKSLEPTICSLVEHLINPLIHIFMKEDGIDTLITPSFEQIKLALEEIHNNAHQMTLNEMIQSLQQKFQEITQGLEERANQT